MKSTCFFFLSFRTETQNNRNNILKHPKRNTSTILRDGVKTLLTDTQGQFPAKLT